MFLFHSCYETSQLLMDDIILYSTSVLKIVSTSDFFRCSYLDFEIGK